MLRENESLSKAKGQDITFSSRELDCIQLQEYHSTIHGEKEHESLPFVLLKFLQKEQ